MIVRRPLLLLLLVVACGPSRSPVGLGVLHFEDDFSTTLAFYNNPTSDAKPVFSAQLYSDTARRALRTTLTKRDTIQFNPLYMVGSRSVLALQVFERKDDWFRVYTDDIRRVMHWVQVIDKEVESWSSFWPTVRTVKSADRSLNPLRHNPDDRARIYDVDARSLCLSVVEMNGAWLKVRNTASKCPQEHIIQQCFEGFMRWKNRDEIWVYFRL